MCRQYGSTTLRITPPAPRLKVKVPVLHIPRQSSCYSLKQRNLSAKGSSDYRPKSPKMDLVTRIQQSAMSQNSSLLTVPTYLFNKDVQY